MTLVIAHRGAHAPQQAPVENTLAAFERARELGAEMVELDVRRLADEELVIFHDHAVAGRNLREMTHRELTAAAGFHPPRLAEALDWARGAEMPLDVELKEDGYITQVADLLQAHRGELLITSFDDRILRRLHSYAPELETGLLVTFTAVGCAQRARLCGASALVVQEKLLDEVLVQNALGHFLGLYVWDVLPDRGAGWVNHPHVRGVITDDVPGLLAARRARAA